MLKGTVKFFNDEKGFGFIMPEAGGDDIFVHKSAVDESGLNTLIKDQKVQFETAKDFKNGKTKAVKITLL